MLGIFASKGAARRGISFLAAGVLLAALLAPFSAFVTVKSLDETQTFLGDSQVVIDSSTGETSPDEFFQELESFSAQTGITVYRFQFDSLTDRNDDILYATGLPHDADVVRQPAFARNHVVSIAPLSSLQSLDGRGLYYLNSPHGSEGAAQRFLDWSQQKGYDGIILTSSVVEFLLAGSSASQVVILVLSCLLLGGAQVLTRPRRFGVHRLLGLNFVRSAWLEVKDNFTVAVTAISFSLACITAFLWWYNGLAYYGYFFLATTLIFAASLVALAAGFSIAWLIASRLDILSSVAGKMPGGLVFVGVFLVRCCAVVLTLSALLMTCGLVADVRARTSFDDAWREHQAAFETGVAAGASDMNPEVLTAVREADGAGKLILSNNYWITWPVDLGAPVFLSNRKFAEDSGIGLGSADKVNIVSEEGLSQEELDPIKDQLDFEASVSGEEVPGIENIAAGKLEGLFTYDSVYRPVVDGPILVVLPEGLRPLGAENLMAMFSQAQLIFADGESYLSVRDAAHASDVWVAGRPHAAAWAEDGHKTRVAAANYGLNLALAASLTTALVVSMSAAFQAARRERLRVGFLMGRNPWWQRRELLGAELAVSAISLAWLAAKASQHNEMMESHVPSTMTLSFEASFSWAIVGAIAILILFFALLSVALVPFFERSQLTLPAQRSERRTS